MAGGVGQGEEEGEDEVISSRRARLAKIRG